MASTDGAPHTADVVGAPPAVEQVKQAAKEQQIDPYNVSGGVDENGNVTAIDYEALRERFNTPALTQEHLDRFERVTGKPPHRLMRRKLFFSHRDFDKILDYYEKYGFFLLYTGRGPSSGSMHLGHAVPFLFTKELQDIFDVPLVVMLTDDEKFLYTRNKNQGKITKGAALGDFIEYAHQNCKDIIALGFDLKKTFIYTDYEYMGGHFYQNITEFEALLTNNQIRGAMGFDGSTNIGLNAYAAKQCVAAFASSYPTLFGAGDFRAPTYEEPRPRKHIAAIPTLIPCAIDQEPYFRLLRENCDRMEFPAPKTALILSKFLTALQGSGGKMSASDPNSAIFMSDTSKQIEKKINRFAFSGGGATKEDHEKYGGNPDVDVAYAYLSYFLESDDELIEIEQSYRKGTLSTGELKKRCIQELQKFVEAFQERRSKVTEEIMREFMTPRKLEFKGNPNATASIEDAVSEKKPEEKQENTSGKLTKGERKALKIAEKKAEKLALREKGPEGEHPKAEES
ncbi:Nucleotidylyl transferase [Aureobasidium pullulans]|uniref:Tryptophan--tRNA ligase, cytoplasmic n=1 Tax=Aureobasidium pullulans TaxID=5580 RepID=A0A4S9ABT7_AURPU|nr:Nucleotidylyl transferase [Aureobasidium pullulans]